MEVKLPTIWADEKQRFSEDSQKRKSEKRREEKRRKKNIKEEKVRGKQIFSVRRKKVQVHKKGRKLANNHVFPFICGYGGSKHRLARAAGARWPDER